MCAMVIGRSLSKRRSPESAVGPVGRRVDSSEEAETACRKWAESFDLPLEDRSTHVTLPRACEGQAAAEQRTSW